MSDYAIRLVRDLAEAIQPALHDGERPRLSEQNGIVGPAESWMAVKPGAVNVFVNPVHRMIVLRGDEYRADLCRKINESRYGPPYRHAPVIGSENSEDATTWSFLRTLERRCRPEWVARVLEQAFGIAVPLVVDRVHVRFWFGRVTDEKLPVPPGVNETATELDALIEFFVAGESHVMAVEAKISSPFSGRERDQLVRVLDVGSYYAAIHYVPPGRYWTLAILPEKWLGRSDQDPHEVVAKYKGKPDALRYALRHRVDAASVPERLGGQDIQVLASHVGAVTWEQLIAIAGDTHDVTLRDTIGPW